MCWGFQEGEHSARCKLSKKNNMSSLVKNDSRKISELWFFLSNLCCPTVDGRNFAPVDMVVYPIMFRALYSPGGAGFLPSTVCSQPTPNPPTNKANTQDPSSSHPTMAPLVNANSMTGHVSLAYTLAIQLVSTWQAVFFWGVKFCRSDSVDQRSKGVHSTSHLSMWIFW